MAEFLKRTIKLEPIKVIYSDGNKIPFAAVTKRKATIREAMYILRNILGFNIDLSLEGCETREEQNELRKEFTEALNNFLSGGDWGCLCSDCYCDDDDNDAFNFAYFTWLISYCQEKGIL